MPEAVSGRSRLRARVSIAWASIALAAVVFASFVPLLLGPADAWAFIPSVDRTLRAIAGVNRASGRTQAFQLDVTMRVGESAPLAQGTLISHPSGLARLELRGYNGRVDRYLLSGSELVGAKDGYRLDRPQPLLQPIFFLQPSSEITLRTALDAFGVRTREIGLATCGDQDCFVIGDPRLSAPLELALDASEDGAAQLATSDRLGDPLADPTAVYDLAATEDASSGDDELGRLEGPQLGLGEDARLARFWVDTEDLQVRRIDRSDGVFTIFGPMVSFGKLRVPAWFEVHEPGAEMIRFEVDRAVQVNAPPQAFSQKWLLTPVDAVAPPGAQGESSPADGDRLTR